MNLREEVLDMKKEVKNLEKEEKSFALEILNDMKKQNKRMFVIVVVILMMYLATIGGFLYYIFNYDYVEETYTTDLDTNSGDNGDSSINISGDIINGKD